MTATAHFPPAISRGCPSTALVLTMQYIAQAHIAASATWPAHLKERVGRSAVAEGALAVSPDIGDIHRVANAYDDRVSISIHIYGGNIGAVARAVYDPDTGAEKPFVSGYSNTAMPNLWDRSTEVRAELATA